MWRSSATAALLGAILASAPVEASSLLPEDALAAVDGDPTRLNIREIMKQPWFVPETAQLDEQLRAFRRQRAHFAVVVDEYGGLR